MPFQENDISWQVLRRIVHDWAGTAAELAEVKPLVGGCINTTLLIRLVDGQRAVLKITPHRIIKSYEEEAYQLNLLREIGLPTPEVYVCHTGSLEDPNSYLLMQFVEGVDLAEAKRRCSTEQFEHLQMHLAELVLAMHERTSAHYMRLGDGTGAPYDSWVKFYHSIYDPIWNDVSRTPMLPVKSRKLIEKLHGKLDRLLVHPDKPRLVHWDLWSTNLLAHPDANGRWWISGVLDPNCKYAHAEAEIAYAELFGTINGAFLRTYQQTWRLPPEYHKLRKIIYQVYPLLNHLRLFGQEYVKPLLATLDKAAAFV